MIQKEFQKINVLERISNHHIEQTNSSKPRAVLHGYTVTTRTIAFLGKVTEREKEIPDEALELHRKILRRCSQ